MPQKVHIIAEAGTNHNGRYEVAEKLVDVAVGAGANSIKFQIIYPEGLYLPKFFLKGQYVKNNVFCKRAAMMLSDDDYRILANFCKSKDIEFSASVFDHRGIDLLDALDVSYIKIASCDLNNSRLLKEASERGRKMIISTGMSTLEEIEHAVSDVITTGNTDIVLMHCVSVYPCKTERTNLGFIKELKRAFGFPVGLSDHTEQSIAGVIAVAMGVEWIEKQLTLNRKLEGFDHAYAMEPSGFQQFVQDMRAAVEACCQQKIKVQNEEIKVRK
ncbi:MAG: N-acetylneuraminate synthase family protein, partial [Candidatus Heimdallarchaeota archaeon]|nr:N-acetylneuraminate synthase family protein [Candidatus Heimdallarchaeota archaeon]